MIKPDAWIKEKCVNEKMIEPFEPKQVREGNISYGVSSFGYDIRLFDEFKFITKEHKDKVFDPKNIDKNLFSDFKGRWYDVPAGGFVIVRSLEYFKIPRNVLAICTGKSTYARMGIIVNVTPLEPEWEGYLTMGIANMSSVSVRLYAMEGIAQLLFFESDQDCYKSYNDKNGKYQKQKKIEIAKL